MESWTEMIFQYLKKENVNIVKGLSIYDKKNSKTTSVLIIIGWLQLWQYVYLFINKWNLKIKT